MTKRYISARELPLDSYRLAVKICDSGFRPDFIVGVWRGGAPLSACDLGLPTWLFLFGRTSVVAGRTLKPIGSGRN